MSETTTEARGDLKAQRRGFFARFLRDRSGSTAIEFAVLALPFSLLVFAILESCIAFAGQQVLSNAADDVARQFRTGQVRMAELPNNEIGLEKLRGMICPKLEVLVSKGCPGLFVNLQNFPTFREAADNTIDVTGDISQRAELGRAMSKNVLRVFYRWPAITDFMSWIAPQTDDDTRLLSAVMVWQNEPFND